jgi:hypothetical protein
MAVSRADLDRYVRNIKLSGLSIYDPLEIGDPNLWIPTPELQALLDKSLSGLSLAGLPIRTRSKVVKESICRALGYPVPRSFQKTKPRFPGQDFDTYVQKANNLQIWNQEISPTRRYVLMRVSSVDVVTRVKIVTGDTLAQLDTTGTLTQKYQASCIPGQSKTELVARTDTARLLPHVIQQPKLMSSPVEHPSSGFLYSIASIRELLSSLVGQSFPDAGRDQERNRGATLHRLVCAALGYAKYQDDGQFPDIRNQLLEVKLQTSPTIDLGLVRPNDISPLDTPKLKNDQIRHCDVRYAVFYATTNGKVVTITNLLLTTGEAFFERFPQFQGKVLNAKLQIPLPRDFFDR